MFHLQRMMPKYAQVCAIDSFSWDGVKPPRILWFQHVSTHGKERAIILNHFLLIQHIISMRIPRGKFRISHAETDGISVLGSSDMQRFCLWTAIRERHPDATWWDGSNEVWPGRESQGLMKTDSENENGGWNGLKWNPSWGYKGTFTTMYTHHITSHNIGDIHS